VHIFKLQVEKDLTLDLNFLRLSRRRYVYLMGVFECLGILIFECLDICIFVYLYIVRIVITFYMNKELKWLFFYLSMFLFSFVFCVVVFFFVSLLNLGLHKYKSRQASETLDPTHASSCSPHFDRLLLNIMS